MSNKKKRKISELECDITFTPNLSQKFKLEREVFVLTNKNRNLEHKVLLLSNEIREIKEKLIPELVIGIQKNNQEMESNFLKFTKNILEENRKLNKKIKDIEYVSKDNSKSNVELELSNLRIEKELSKLNINIEQKDDNYMSYIN